MAVKFSCGFVKACKRQSNDTHFCSYCACASSYNAIVLMGKVGFTEGLSKKTFGSRSIFLAHDNAGSKFDKHPISIDFTGYKNTYKLIV